MIQTYSLIPCSSLKSRLSSLRSKKPLLLVKTRCLGSWPLWMMFVSCMWFWSSHSAHTSSCLGLNPQQLWSRRLWIWKRTFINWYSWLIFSIYHWYSWTFLSVQWKAQEFFLFWTILFCTIDCLPFTISHTLHNMFFMKENIYNFMAEKNQQAVFCSASFTWMLFFWLDININRQHRGLFLSTSSYITPASSTRTGTTASIHPSLSIC